MTHELSAELQDWRDRGQYIDAFGIDVFAVDEGPRDAPAIVVLHGYPTFSYDFSHVIDRWTETHRVVVHDHPGFGLSEKPENYSYSLLEQAEVAVEVWRQLGLDSGHLLAHDYGTSVATELLARRERDFLPFEFETVTLCNGSMHVELCEMSLTQKALINEVTGPMIAKFASFRLFRQQIRRIISDPDSISERELELLWEGLEFRGGRERIHQISRYQLQREKYWHRWIGALTHLDLPTHVVWGRKDTVAVPAIADALADEIPGVETTWLEDLGHYPMLEDPERWGRAVMGFIER